MFGSEGMSEKRKLSRHRTLKPGTIAFKNGGAISYIVRNVSLGGACIEVANPIGVPDDFTLVIEADHMQQPCHIAWRKDTQIGVDSISRPRWLRFAIKPSHRPDQKSKNRTEA